MMVLMAQPVIRRRLEAAVGKALREDEIQCLTALAFLHDIGKLAPGFQAKGWAESPGLNWRGHLECGWLWTRVDHPEPLGKAGAILADWPDLQAWFEVLFAHHGRPVRLPKRGIADKAFPRLAHYDWVAEAAVLGGAMLVWFPAIETAQPPPAHPALLHFYCGLLTLADWIGSDRAAFPFEPEFRADYWTTALQRARARIDAIGLGADGLHLRGRPGWNLVSDYPQPRPAQAAIGAVPPSQRLVLIEAETGSGKTEAALWRFLTLAAAGEVDALYFAVPTRAAARQLHNRVNAALARLFDPAPEALLAIPGQVKAGDVSGTRLPDFGFLWDDSEHKPTRWAAEHAARYLAARVAVGTVDQVALGGLQVKYAHLRGASLARALVVIDEVHASDAYMTEVQTAMVRAHLALGGHVLLMSATLGAVARRKWFGEAAGSFAQDVGLPYPAVWTKDGITPVTAEPKAAKRVRVEARSGWSGADAAALALGSARAGARVLVIRNTVARAQETFAACAQAAAEMLLSVNGIATLHHSRFAAEDRARLDAAVEEAIGKASPMAGRIVIGTQTLEQSLDLCADLLITDLCPMDVLLQRIGRLHRHHRARPRGFETARAVIMTPPGGLDPLLVKGENGLGRQTGGPSLGGIYVGLPGLAATLMEIEAHPVWEIPAMNRALVEAATHPQALDTIAETRGWQAYHQELTCKVLAEMQTASLVLLDRTRPLPDQFPEDALIRTRLGEEGAVITLPDGTIGPFGAPISRLGLPAYWSHGVDDDSQVEVEPGSPLRLRIGPLALTYGPEGVRKA